MGRTLGVKNILSTRLDSNHKPTTADITTTINNLVPLRALIFCNLAFVPLERIDSKSTSSVSSIPHSAGQILLPQSHAGKAGLLESDPLEAWKYAAYVPSHGGRTGAEYEAADGQAIMGGICAK